MSSPCTEWAWVAIGANVGNRGAALRRLRELLQRDGVVEERVSTEILTRPVGNLAQGDFHNQLVVLRAPGCWTPHRWLQHCKDAETAAGRRTGYRWGPRVADADILLLGERGELHVDDPDLVVPHRALRDRPFLRRLLGEFDDTSSRIEAAAEDESGRVAVSREADDPLTRTAG